MSWSSEHIKWLMKTDEIVQTADGKDIEVYEFNYDNTDEETMSAWANHFRNHYCSDTEIDFFREGYGYSRSEYLNNIKFPDEKITPGPSIRSGDFGEILIADYLEFILNFWVPRTRYGDKTIRNESTKGSDIIGFRIIDNQKANPNDTLAIFEAKAQLTGKSANPRLQNSIDDSSKDYIRRAESLNAIKQRLYDKEGEEVASKIDRFQNLADNPYKEIYGAAAIFTDSAYDIETISTTDSSNHSQHKKLSLIVIKGNDLMALTHELYRRAANEA